MSVIVPKLPDLVCGKTVQAAGSPLDLNALVPAPSQVIRGSSERVSLPQPVPWVHGASTVLICVSVPQSK